MAGISHHILDRPSFDGAPKLLVVVSPYYKDIADDLVQGALAEVEAVGGKADVVEVPGVLEIPTAVGMASRMSNYDGFVALGCAIRGETPQYETLRNDSSRGLTLLGVQGVCLGNGILTVENHEQAAVHADPEGPNKGGAAAAAALHLIALGRKWGGSVRGVGFTHEILMAGGTDTV